MGAYARTRPFQNISVHPVCLDTLRMAIHNIESTCEDSILLVVGSLHLAGALRPTIASLAHQQQL